MTSRLDRTGDEIDDQLPLHDPRCRNGWLGDSYDSDSPRPCPTCKPKAAKAAQHRPLEYP